MNDLDTHLHLNDLRLRILNKQQVTPEEMRLVLDNLRQGRMKAMRDDKASTRAAKKASKPAKSISTPVDLTKLFD